MAAASLTFGLAGSPAHGMSVAQFIIKVDALKGRGMGAMFSKDAGLLKTEMEGISAAYRADLLAARQGKRPPHSCPPPKGKARIASTELMQELRAIPAAHQRTTSMKTAFYALMKKRYPCP